MTLLDARDMESTSPAASTLGAPATTRPSTRGYWIRMALAVGLTALAYGPLYSDVVDDALRGSRTAFLLVVPVLLVMAAAGFRTAPRGVADAESDWIVSVMIGSAGFLAIHLISDRLPTLAGLWRLPMMGAVVWFAALLTVMFGIRHVVRMWHLWLLAVFCTTPLPFLFITAALGGTDAAAVVTAAAFGAIAVALALRAAPLRLRLLAACGCLAVAAALGIVATVQFGLLVATVLAAGVAPVATVAVVGLAFSRADGHHAAGSGPLALPRRSPASLAVLALVAVVLVLLNPSTEARTPAESPAADWAGPSALTPTRTTTYPFITRYFGDGSRLERYDVPTAAGMPAAAVDVLTAPAAALFDDFADAVWYPSEHPLSYQAATPSESMPLGARVIHSNAETATNGSTAHWYAVTWTWTFGDMRQQVTVIISQSAGQSPPEPAPLSVSANTLRPALWVARQQPVSTGQVDELVIQRASDLVARIAADARGHHDGQSDA